MFFFSFFLFDRHKASVSALENNTYLMPFGFLGVLRPFSITIFGVRNGKSGRPVEISKLQLSTVCFDRFCQLLCNFESKRAINLMQHLIICCHLRLMLRTICVHSLARFRIMFHQRQRFSFVFFACFFYFH